MFFVSSETLATIKAKILIKTIQNFNVFMVSVLEKMYILILYDILSFDYCLCEK